tara:strand:+ start:437 stop:757 length:321 start_codon:yes stop_codon:yes gene_type:complete
MEVSMTAITLNIPLANKMAVAAVKAVDIKKVIRQKAGSAYCTIELKTVIGLKQKVYKALKDLHGDRCETMLTYNEIANVIDETLNGIKPLENISKAFNRAITAAVA